MFLNRALQMFLNWAYVFDLLILPGQDSGVQVSEGGGRGGICQVVDRYVDGLHRVGW